MATTSGGGTLRMWDKDGNEIEVPAGTLGGGDILAILEKAENEQAE